MEQVNEHTLKDMIEKKPVLITFFITPLCGTCRLAEKSLQTADMLFPNLPFYKGNVNEMADFVQQEKIQSVPCVKIYRRGKCEETLYSMGPIEHLIERMAVYNEA